MRRRESLRKRWFLMGFIVGATSLTGALAWAQSPTRDITPTERTLDEKLADIVPVEGEYRALIVGINQYRHAPKLDTAVADAKGVRDVLVERYGFKRGNIKTLLDGDATRSNIEGALIRLAKDAGPNDSVLIYYAGHGQYSDDNRLAWWVPVEGVPSDEGTFILDAAVRNYVAAMKARHVYLIADSCFSGTLFAQSRALESQVTDKYYAKLYAKRPRRDSARATGLIQPFSTLRH